MQQCCRIAREHSVEFVVRRTGLLVITAVATAALALPASASSWLYEVGSRLRGHQIMPRSAVIRGASCVARVRFSVDANGMLTDYEILKPCAEPILTRSTDDLLFKVGQLPPPPTGKPARGEIDVSWPPQG